MSEIDFKALRCDSIAEEQLLLAHALLNPTLAPRIAQQLDINELDCVGPFKEAFAKIRDCIKAKKTVSRVELIELVEPIFQSNPVIDAELKQRVEDAKNDVKDGRYYLRRAVDRAGRRQILRDINGQEVLSETWTTTDALAKIRERMLSISRTSASATGRGGLLRKDYHENIDALHDRLSGKVETKLYTGFKTFDTMVGGIESASYNIIGARPSIGKTAVSINLALAFARQGYRVAFIQLEVEYDKMLELMACALCNIQKNAVSDKATQQTRQRISEAYEELHKLPIELYSNCPTLGDIMTIAEDAVSRKIDPVQILFIDYFQIVRIRQRMETTERLNAVSRAFFDLKSQHRVALFVAAQLNRNSAEGPPKLEDLKGTGDLEQDAETVTLLYRPNKAKVDEGKAGFRDDQIDFFIRKSRNGRTGRVSYHWDGSTGIVSEMDERDAEVGEVVESAEESSDDFATREELPF